MGKVAAFREGEREREGALGSKASFLSPFHRFLS